jgi:DNA invertase Pin-like site-specific DNA recombinase
MKIETNTPVKLEEKLKYCLYCRKSSESEERQVMSIDSQIKEMLNIAEREKLEIVNIKREAHSAKETGQRPVYNEMIADLKEGKFNAILTWAPDRISRNASEPSPNRRELCPPASNAKARPLDSPRRRNCRTG